MSEQKDGTYRVRISSKFTGLILILIDQSESMEADYGGRTKDIVAADAVNQVIYTIRGANQDGTEYKDRCFVGVIGYGEKVESVFGGELSTFEDEILDRRPIKGASADFRMPIWVLPKASNTTPMDRAFLQAHDLAASWIKHHSESFPPVILNVSDGVPNDMQNDGDGQKTKGAAEKLISLSTDDGGLLLFNAHISNPEEGEILLPNNRAALPNRYAQFLFDITSPIPERLVKLAVEAGFKPDKGARGMVFNAGADLLVKFLDFGSGTMI